MTTSISGAPVVGLQVPRVVPGQAPHVSEVSLPRRRAGAGEAVGRRNPVVRQRGGGELRLGRVLAVAVVSLPLPHQSGLEGGVAQGVAGTGVLQQWNITT